MAESYVFVVGVTYASRILDVNVQSLVSGSVPGMSLEALPSHQLGPLLISGTPTTAGTYVINYVNRMSEALSLTIYVEGGGGGGGEEGKSSDTGPDSTYNTYVPDAVSSIDPYTGGSRTTGDTNCYLTRKYGNTTATFYLPNIQSIEETDNITVTDISTIVMGYDNNFVMDTGSLQKFTVNLRRVQPASPNDSSTDQSRWTNGYWFEQLKDFTDRWQNLYKNTSGESTGGFTFYFAPYSESYMSGVSYSDLYPTLTRNVFLSGQISVRNSPDNLKYIDVTIPLTVSSMVETTPAIETVNITFRPGSLSGVTSYTLEFPKNMESSVPNPSSDWADAINSAGYAFNYWTDSNGTQYSPGSTFEPESGMVLTASWVVPYGWTAFNGKSGETYEVTIPSGAKTAIYYLIGPGGDGGRGYYDKQHILLPTIVYFGGGGGSGAYVTGSISVSTGTLSLYVSSTETAIYYDNVRVAKANKGGNGGDARSSGSGSAGIGASPGGFDGYATQKGGEYSSTDDSWLTEAVEEIQGAAQESVNRSFPSASGGPFTSYGQLIKKFYRDGGHEVEREATYGGGGSGSCFGYSTAGALGLAVVAFRR